MAVLFPHPLPSFLLGESQRSDFRICVCFLFSSFSVIFTYLFFGCVCFYLPSLCQDEVPDAEEWELGHRRFLG